MLNMTPFGIFHTLLGLIAVGAGIVAFVNHGGIGYRSRAGRVFVWMTVITCATGFFIFHHGGFGKPHMLGIATLVVLAVAYWSELRQGSSKRWTLYLSTASYSFAFFLHFIPGFTETLTRVPLGNPWASNADDPKLAMLIGAAFVVFSLALVVQLLRLKSQPTPQLAPYRD